MDKEQIIKAQKKRLLFLPHALKQMARLDRMISTQEVNDVITFGEIIEDYPNDPRGESCLMAYINERPIHVV